MKRSCLPDYDTKYSAVSDFKGFFNLEEEGVQNRKREGINAVKNIAKAGRMGDGMSRNDSANKKERKNPLLTNSIFNSLSVYFNVSPVFS